MFGMLCADASGKGVAAALLSASLQSVLRGYTVCAKRGATDSEPALAQPSEVVQHANDELLKRIRPGSYATVFWCDYDTKRRVLRYTNAGHNAPLLLTQSADRPVRLNVGGVPVGLLPDASYEEQEIRLEPGSLLVAFTDGISEAANDAGEEFSEERLIDVVLQRRDASPGAICSAIVDAVRQWSESQKQLDDMTVVALKTA